MSAPRIRKFTALAAAVTTAAAGLVGLSAGVAVATTAANAQLIGGAEVVSTQSRALDVRVQNPGLNGNTDFINSVIVVPQVPSGGTVPLMTVTSGSANGWTVTLRPNGGIQYDAPGSPTTNLKAPLAPGQTADFAFTARAAAVAQDTPVVWEVDTSTDGGKTYTQDSLAKGGKLSSVIRVLLNGAPHINFLTGTGNVTAGQQNLTLSQDVTNYGTSTLTVTPTISGSSGDGLRGTAAALALLPGQTITVTSPVQFGSAGTARSLWGGFTAPGATSSPRSTATYDVQAPVTLSYDGTVPLAPKAAASSSSKTFALSVQKGGDPAVTLTTATVLGFTNSVNPLQTFSSPLSSATTLPAGSTGKALSFGPTVIPGNPMIGDWDGAYTPQISVTGTDANGAPVSLDVAVSDLFAVDSLGPVAQPVLSTPDRQAQVGDTRNANTAQPYVAKNGDTVSFGGPIYANANTQTTSSTAQVACSVDAFNGAQLLSEQSVSCSNSGGQLSGSASVTYPSNTTSAALKVVTQDIAGNSTTTTSNIIVVDNVLPTFAHAATGCGWPVPWTCINQQNIRIQLTEPVTGQFNISNFAVTVNGTEVPVTKLQFYGSASVFSNLLSLNLGSPIGPDDRPLIRYIPSSPAPAADQALNEMSALSQTTAVDRIPAPLPHLDQVGGKAAYSADGHFYVNQPSTTYAISNTQQGDTVSVYADTDGQPGLQPTTDLLLCQVTPTASTSTCNNPNSALPADGTYTLDLQAVDPAGNVSTADDGTQWSSAVQVLDRTAPTIAGFTTDSSGVTVQLTEILGDGRDFASDWSVNNGQSTFVVGSVSAPDPTHRRLWISSNDWASAATSISYLFQGTDPTQRYVDLAGNYFADQSYSPV